MFKKTLALCALVAAPFAGAGCSSADDLDAEGTASAVIAITTVPTGVQCLSITATGSRAVTSTFSVMTGAAATLSMQGLPTGSVTFTGNAFAATCSAVLPSDVATFVGVPTVAQLSVATVAQVTLPMTRNGRANVTVDFEGDSTTCAASGQTCDPANPISCCSGLTCTAGPGGVNTCTSATMCASSGQSCNPTQANSCCSGLTCTTSAAGTSTCSSATMCGSAGQSCNPTQANSCCSGLTCTTSASGQSTCSSATMCGSAGQACSPAQPNACCPGLTCVTSAGGLNTCG